MLCKVRNVYTDTIALMVVRKECKGCSMIWYITTNKLHLL